MRFSSFFYKPKNLSLFLASCCAFILAFAFFAQHVLEIPLCRMCLVERYTYFIATLIGLILFFVPFHTPVFSLLKYLLMATFLTSLGFSLYHIGLEHGWFELPSFCKIDARTNQSIESMRAQIMAQQTTIPCNEIPLRLVFLSLAEWNGIASLILVGFSWILVRRK